MDQFIKKITRHAGDLILKKYKKISVKHTKANPADVVTEADLEANKYLVQEIKKKYPEHGIISEEMGEENTGAEYVWVIDPLDGTRNFATQVPLWGVLVGLLRHNKMYMAVVYDPLNSELVYAQKGKGSFLNNKKVKCSKTKELSFSYGILSGTVNSKDIVWIKRLSRLAEQSGGFGIWQNSFACAATATTLIASGRRDWKVARGAMPWDYAIPALILEEAGCKISKFNGDKWEFGDREIVVANPVLHKKLLKVINK